MGKLNLKLGCLVYQCFSCSTFLFTEKSLHKDLPVVILRYFYKDRKTHVLHERHNPTDLICTWYCLSSHPHYSVFLKSFHSISLIKCSIHLSLRT